MSLMLDLYVTHHQFTSAIFIIKVWYAISVPMSSQTMKKNNYVRKHLQIQERAFFQMEAEERAREQERVRAKVLSVCIVPNYMFRIALLHARFNGNCNGTIAMNATSFCVLAVTF